MTELLEQYRLLDVSADVSYANLRQAYKDLAFVWHPDRFSGNPRLQKKAEEKLKSINQAYQQLSERHRQREASPTAANQMHRNENAPSGPTQQAKQQSKQQYRSRSNPYRRRASNRQRSRTARQSPPFGSSYQSDISFPQACFLLTHFQFRTARQPSQGAIAYKSGPFRLVVNAVTEMVFLENLCDCINGFHPILLSIPCKASAVFSGSEARELIRLLG